MTLQFYFFISAERDRLFGKAVKSRIIRELVLNTAEQSAHTL